MTEEHLDSQTKEALDYWGYLFEENRSGTHLLDRLLSGIHDHILKTFEPTPDTFDITPSQLAAFYRAVGGDYDILFVKEPPSAIAFIFKSLGCLHSLQPALNEGGYAAPAIPALKKKGFITWQTVQLLLGPEEHVEFLQNAVRLFDIRDPESGSVFPKILPKQSFPNKPDERMMEWYEKVGDKLRKDALVEEKKAARRKRSDGFLRSPSEDASGESSADDRSGAATYFRDPLYRNRDGRPTIIRRFSRETRSPREFMQSRGRLVANTVRQFVTPWARRKSLPEKEGEGAETHEDDDVANVNIQEVKYARERRSPRSLRSPRSPLSSRSPPRQTPPSRRTPLDRRRESFTSTESESDDASRQYRDDSTLRQRRSYEVSSSPREYFPSYEAPRRYSHAQNHRPESNGPSNGFVPTREPMFATQVAQMQPRSRKSSAAAPGPGRYDGGQHRTFLGHDSRQRAPTIVEPPDRYEDRPRGSRRRPSSEHRDHDRHYDRDRARNRDRDRERARSGSREKERPRIHRYVTPVDGVSGRHYPNGAPWR